MNVDVTINSGLNVEAVFSGNDIAVSVAFADPLKVDVEILAGTKGIKGDSMFQQVGTEIIPIDENATLDACFIANLPEIDNEVTELSPNPVKGSGIWAALQALWESVQNLLGLHVNADNDAHPATAISHKDSTVAERLDNITAGSIARDVDGNITGITTFGEATTINRDVDGNITGWENDTHEWTLTKTGDTITGWAVAEKP